MNWFIFLKCLYPLLIQISKNEFLNSPKGVNATTLFTWSLLQIGKSRFFVCSIYNPASLVIIHILTTQHYLLRCIIDNCFLMYRGIYDLNWGWMPLSENINKNDHKNSSLIWLIYMRMRFLCPISFLIYNWILLLDVWVIGHYF